MSTTTTRFISFITLTAALLSLSKSFELPFLQTCTFEDKKCHREQVDKFFEMYANGIEELNVPTLDPMYLGNISIQSNSNNNFNLQLYMENVVLHKYPKVKCLDIKGFIQNMTKPMRMVFKTFTPELIINTHCRLKGQLLLFKVAGETDLKIVIKNVTTIMKVKSLPYSKEGLTYYKAKEMIPSLQIGSFTTSFANSTLFNGEEIFIKTFADTINENWKVLSDEIEPHINDAVGRVAIQALNKILATIPHNKFFKESE